MIETYLIQAGKNGPSKLAIEAQCSLRIVYSIKNDGHIPRAELAYRLALACGCGDEEALALAKECSSETARETA